MVRPASRPTAQPSPDASIVAVRDHRAGRGGRRVAEQGRELRVEHREALRQVGRPLPQGRRQQQHQVVEPLALLGDEPVEQEQRLLVAGLAVGTG